MSKSIIIALISLIAGALIYHLLFQKEPLKYESTRIIRDTIYKIEQREPIILSKVEPKIMYLRDTVYLSKPFIAILDTIVKTDTIFVSYEFPENLIELAVKHRQDTNMIAEITFRQEESKKEAISENPVLMVALIIIGLLLGNITK